MPEDRSTPRVAAGERGFAPTTLNRIHAGSNLIVLMFRVVNSMSMGYRSGVQGLANQGQFGANSNGMLGYFALCLVMNFSSYYNA